MTSRTAKFPFFKNAQPLDQVSILLMMLLSVLITIAVFSGDRTAPQVREFSWENQQIGAEDQGFILTFNRPMNRKSVEEHLRIDPPLPGKISWAGRRMAYTLLEPAPYGTPFSLQLQGATDQLYGKNKKSQLIEPFTGYFRTRDRAFVYLGVQGEEEGRLILVNLSKEPKPVVLTPDDLVVLEFEAFPTGDRILFSAINRQERKQGQFAPQLYTVTTGMHRESSKSDAKSAQIPGEIEQVLDAKTYRNLKFDLSPDGKTVVVHRVHKTNVTDASPWILEFGKSPKPLLAEGGDFLIAPDSKSLIIAQGPDLTTLLPLEPQADPLEYLPKFGQVLNFAADGSAAAMVKFNPDGTRSLFLVTNQGEERELYRTPEFGNIISAQFDPTQTILYCLITELLDNPDEYQEQPYIVAIDLKTEEVVPLVILPNQQDININLSPDGLALLFDQKVTQVDNGESTTETSRTKGGNSITTSRLWLLPLTPTIPEDGSQPQWQPEPLPFFGFNPQWLP